MTKNTENGLIIFIKNPILGKVKTRLAQTTGPEKALQIYRALLTHTRDLALEVPCDRYLFYSDFIDPEDSWEKESFHKRLQQEGDLGQKMQHAFAEVLQNHQRAVIIGSDCATLTAQILKDAFSALEDRSYVVGPAIDGGYYLLGMNKLTPELFSGIAWSTSSVFRDTLERLQATGANYHLTPELSDIDFEEDWDKFGWEI